MPCWYYEKEELLRTPSFLDGVPNEAFPRYVTAACCLMLAGKVEETPKKCRDIIGTARALLPDYLMEQFGTDPRVFTTIPLPTVPRYKYNFTKGRIGERL
ncbi:unnamed protein product [Dibothriocephalus latus]|uniref:Uncharacterized protein n=1 Tax=Dibothriocephalus latus TaxID=60516 RepID=A0A3P7NNF7_DIBLA|nr:unnamed protein product [Dibothriocephalus latus]